MKKKVKKAKKMKKIYEEDIGEEETEKINNIYGIKIFKEDEDEKKENENKEKENEKKRKENKNEVLKIRKMNLLEIKNFLINVSIDEKRKKLSSSSSSSS